MRNYVALLLFFIAALFIQCNKKGPADDNFHNDADRPLPENPLMQLIPAAQSGIDFNNIVEEDFATNIVTFAYLYNGGGVGVIDVNNDGLQDLYFTSTTGKCKLYQNKGDFKFEDITDKAGVGAEEGMKSGVTVVDINADGWQDIYVCRTGLAAGEDRRNLLFINQKNGTFKESAKEYGLADISACTVANFFDYDNDGDLDMYLVVYPDDFKLVMKLTVKELSPGNIRRTNNPMGDYHSDRLYRNNGDGTFSDVSRIAGIWNRTFGLSANVSDFNNDGFLDLYIGNDYVEPDFVYMNTGNGSFLERHQTMFRHLSENTMGSDLADVNNDGLQDVLALDMLAENFILQKERLTTRTIERYNTLTGYGYGHQQERNVLQINNGNGSFSEMGCLAGVFQTDWSWAILAQDFDNDGWKDIYVTNGYRRDITNADYMKFTSDSINKLPGGLGEKNFDDIYAFYRLIPEHRLQNYMFRNQANLKYENVSTPWGMVQTSFSNGAAYADLDNDGDLEVIVNNIDREAFIYKNTSVEKNKGNWLQIKLKGKAGNPFATNAKVRITTAGEVQYQELSPTRGFVSSVEPIIHFGLGGATSVDKLEVEFPGREVIVMNNVKSNQRLELDAANAKPGKLAPLAEQKPFIQDMSDTRGLVFNHQEDAFQDFDRERLIPWKLSTPGPEIAVGDANGDGREDVFVCNGTGGAASLMVQNANGAFSAASQSVWDADKGLEDGAAVFLDADADGDQDLVVAGGGNTAPANDPTYRLRYYENQGNGQYQPKGDRLPAINTPGGDLLAYDYDQDGDTDLIFGGYCVPGAYPTAPPSYVLENDGSGKFTDATNSVAPDFGKYGMVRDLELADVDGDGTDELVVVGEWAGVKIFKVNGGKFNDVSEQWGLTGTNGFWKSVHVTDVDGDGDEDLVCGNLGLNTRFTASATEPLDIYAKDFDGNGSIDPVMTLYYGGKRYPVPTRDILILQIPKLKKDFVRYTPFARSTIEDIFKPDELESSTHLQVHTLESSVFINEGGRFKRQPLSNLAQAFPVFGIVSADVNRDGNMDLIVAGNDYGQQVETGRIDTGNGAVLLGDGAGSFSALPSRVSGLWANREARSLALIRAGNRNVILVGNNSNRLQAFTF